MPTLEENSNRWLNKKMWLEEDNKGDAWSAVWGGTPYLWSGTILPRILKFLPAGHILEIAPGFGRCTQYLIDYAQETTLVDISSVCIEHCQERFKNYSNINYYANDGKSLDMIKDNSIDFIFSWDSMVHAESDVLRDYIQQSKRILKPEGIGFIHHSNIGTYKDNGKIGKIPVPKRHWRAESMNAGLFRKYCQEAGLKCISQELLDWGESGYLIDCISLYTKDSKGLAGETRITENIDFMKEAHNLRRISEIYDVAR